MIVTTKSGSQYVFTVSNGSFWVLFGRKEIKVTEIQNLEIGKRMKVRGHALDIYCRPQESFFEFTTSEVVRIEG